MIQTPPQMPFLDMLTAQHPQPQGRAPQPVMHKPMASLMISHLNLIQTCQTPAPKGDAGQMVLEPCQPLEIQLMLQCMAIHCMECHLLHRHHMWMLSQLLLTRQMKQRAIASSIHTMIFSSRRLSRVWRLQLLTSNKGSNYFIRVTGDKR